MAFKVLNFKDSLCAELNIVKRMIRPMFEYIPYCIVVYVIRLLFAETAFANNYSLLLFRYDIQKERFSVHKSCCLKLAHIQWRHQIFMAFFYPSKHFPIKFRLEFYGSFMLSIQISFEDKRKIF